MINVVRAIVLSLLIGVSTPLIAQTNTGGTLPPERERAALTHWQAGQYVSNKAVEWFGINHCFVIDTISSSVLKRMTGKSYPKDCPIKSCMWIHCKRSGLERLSATRELPQTSLTSSANSTMQNIPSNSSRLLTTTMPTMRHL